MSFTDTNYLRDCMVKALILLEMTPCGKSFTKEEIKFFQDLYLWRRPDKFFNNDNEARIISGTTAIYQGTQKTLQFVFDNGYVWMASITKLNRNRIKECKQIARNLLDEEIRELADVA